MIHNACSNHGSKSGRARVQDGSPTLVRSATPYSFEKLLYLVKVHQEPEPTLYGSHWVGFVLLWPATLSPARPSSHLTKSKKVSSDSVIWDEFYHERPTCPRARPGIRTLAQGLAPGLTSCVWPVRYGVKLSISKQNYPERSTGYTTSTDLCPNRSSDGFSTFRLCKLSVSGFITLNVPFYQRFGP